MRFRFKSTPDTKKFIQALEDEHLGWQYGRRRTEVFTGKNMPVSVMQAAEDLKADYDHK